MCAKNIYISLCVQKTSIYLYVCKNIYISLCVQKLIIGVYLPSIILNAFVFSLFEDSISYGNNEYKLIKLKYLTT